MFSAGDLGWRKLEERREEVKVMFSAGDLGGGSWRKGGRGERQEVKVMFSEGDLGWRKLMFSGKLEERRRCSVQ